MTPRPTLAEGASIAQPVRGREVLAALRRSGGGTVAVSEAAIEAALMELARTGLYVEPTCAMAAAALSDLTASGAIRPGGDHRGGAHRHRHQGDAAHRRASGPRPVTQAR